MSEVTLITVHGTSDAETESHGEKWWQTGSAFQGKLRALSQAPHDALAVEPFHWDGENSDVSRRKAGQQLARRVRATLRQGRRVVLACHSHGGNIASYACEDRLIRAAARSGDVSIVSIGTPFLGGRPRLVSILNLLARRAVIVSILALLAVLAWGLTSQSARVMSSGGELTQAALSYQVAARDVSLMLRTSVDQLDVTEERIALIVQAGGDPDAFAEMTSVITMARRSMGALRWILTDPWQVIAGAAALAALILARPILSLFGWLGDRLRARRFRPNPALGPFWRVVAHPQDEAIALLQAAPNARLAPVAPGALPRAVRRTSPVIAVIAAIAGIWTLIAQSPALIQAVDSRTQDVIADRIARSGPENLWLFIASSAPETLAPYAASRPIAWSEETGAFVITDAEVRAAIEADDQLRPAVAAAMSDAGDVYRRSDELTRRLSLVIGEYLEAFAVPIIILLAVAILLSAWL
ncbi:MAG: hypothetical protein MI723_06115, partial [Caulobacterales bacterium]|nr:hypothetical protein [Caulobacterales bacterium]